MENCLKPEHNLVFKIAWSILPGEVAQRLEEIIWKVDSVDTLVGHMVIFPDGSIFPDVSKGQEPITEEKLGVCAHNKDYTQACICFSSVLDEKQEYEGVYYVLHELAHGIEHADVRDKKRELAKTVKESELPAIRQAGEWVEQAIENGEIYAHLDQVLKAANLDFWYYSWAYRNGEASESTS